MMEMSDCPNLVTDWAMGNRIGPCEDCGHPKNKHPRQQEKYDYLLDRRKDPTTESNAPIMLVEGCGPNPHQDQRMSNKTYSILSYNTAMGASNYRPLPNSLTEHSMRTKPVVRRQKQFWNDEEDKLLLKLVQKYGHNGLWPNIALNLVNRTGKQCRERFLNHLSPDIKRSPWTTEEDNTILRLHSMLGSRWSKYVEHLPGRSDNAIKNRWNSINGTMIRERMANFVEVNRTKEKKSHDLDSMHSFNIEQDVDERQAVTREWSHSLLKAMNVVCD